MMTSSTAEKTLQKLETTSFAEWYELECQLSQDELPSFTRYRDRDSLWLKALLWDQGPIMNTWIALMVINMVLIVTAIACFS